MNCTLPPDARDKYCHKTGACPKCGWNIENVLSRQAILEETGLTRLPNGTCAIVYGGNSDGESSGVNEEDAE